jgi:2-amino-4-hydroxy-6-hydroxymethyldihydropteridine diphosphokinase
MGPRNRAALTWREAEAYVGWDRLKVRARMAADERVFLGLGSNLGQREENVRAALNHIASLPETRVVRTSALIETAPWGVEDQPPFINAVTEIRTGLEPLELLDAAKTIEMALGRVKSYRWGPRLVDIDVLIYGGRRLRTPRLTLPHPGLLERPFVVEPLAEIAPEVIEELRRASVSLRSAGS